jgi:hypothetical protein
MQAMAAVGGGDVAARGLRAELVLAAAAADLLRLLKG